MKKLMIILCVLVLSHFLVYSQEAEKNKEAGESETTQVNENSKESEEQKTQVAENSKDDEFQAKIQEIENEYKDKIEEQEQAFKENLELKTEEWLTEKTKYEEKISSLEQKMQESLELSSSEWQNQKLAYEEKITSLEKSLNETNNMDIDNTLGVIQLIIVYLEVLKRGIKDKKMSNTIKERVLGNPSFAEFIGVMEYIMDVDSDLR